MPSERPARRFQDILDNIARIEAHVAGLDLDGFLTDAKTMDAVERCLSRISEAAVKLGNSGPDLAPDVPWHDVRGLGNHLRHGYDAIVPARLWTTVKEDLPLLARSCREAIGRLQER